MATHCGDRLSRGLLTAFSAPSPAKTREGHQRFSDSDSVKHQIETPRARLGIMIWEPVGKQFAAGIF